MSVEYRYLFGHFSAADRSLRHQAFRRSIIQGLLLGGHVEIDTALLPLAKSKNSNRILKTALAKIYIPDAKRYSLKGCRQGVTTEIKRSASTLATVLGIVGWRVPCYLYCIDLRGGEEECMGELISIIDPGEESSDEDGASVAHDPSCGSAHNVYN